MLRSLAILGMIAAAPFQDDVKVTASLSNASVVTGATVTLEVRIETPGVRPVRVNLPPLPPGLNVVGTQDFTHDQIAVPGGRLRIVQRNFVLSADRPGTYVLPSVPVEVDRTTYRTAPLELHVLPGGLTRPTAPIGDDEIRLFASMDRDTVYVGEQAVLQVEALFPRDVRQRQTRPATFETPNPSGFWISELPGGLTGGVRLYRGDVFETQRYRRVYVPLEPGRYTLDPVRLRYELRRGHLYAAESRELVSDSLRIVVLPLPDRGRPGAFTGAVGRYEARAWLQPSAVAAGDAVTLSVEVTGTGNVKTLPPPRLPQLDGVEIFPPSEAADVTVRNDRLGGTKRFTWVLVPGQEGEIDLGAIEYAFFDPETGRYGVSRADPLRLSVESPASDASAAADTALSPIRPSADAWSAGFVWSRAYAAVQVVPLLALLIAVVVRRRRHAPATARREVRARWEAALTQLGHDGPENGRAFLDHVAAAVRAALADIALSPSLRATPADAARAQLEAAGVSAYAATACAALLRRIDHARFGGSPLRGSERNAILAEARAVLTRIDDELSARPRSGATPLAFALLFVLAQGGTAQAADPFRSGVAAYLRDDAMTAVAAFEAHLERAPDDARAWYNLGNALRGAGDTGRAIWAWRRALELEPRDGHARRNLRIAGGDAVLVGGPPRWSLSASETLVALSILWWIGAAALAWLLLRPSPLARRTTLGVGALALLVVLAGGQAWVRAPSAIALAPRTALLAGPAARSDTVAVVPAGTPARVIDREGEWLRLRTSDQAEGWSSAARFAPIPMRR